MTVLPLLLGSQVTPNCGAKLWFGWLTALPRPGPNWLRAEIAGKSLSVRPVSRTYRRPRVTVMFGLNFQASPKYQKKRLPAPSPPRGKPNDDFSDEKPSPLPRITFETG